MWDQKIDKAIREGRIRLNPKTGKPEYLVEAGRNNNMILTGLVLAHIHLIGAFNQKRAKISCAEF